MEKMKSGYFQVHIFFPFFFEKSFGNEVRPFKLKRGRSMVIIDNDEMKRMKGKKKVMRRTSADKRKFFARYMCQKCNNGTVTGETRHAIRRAHAYHKAIWTNSTISPWKKITRPTTGRLAPFSGTRWDAAGMQHFIGGTGPMTGTPCYRTAERTHANRGSAGVIGSMLFVHNKSP